MIMPAHSRSRLRHAPPWTFSLRARLSKADLPGTWGFGLWNDPFGLSLGFGGKPARLPALPQTAWFMHASPPNWLSLQDDPAPASDRPFPPTVSSPERSARPASHRSCLLPGLLAFPLMRDQAGLPPPAAAGQIGSSGRMRSGSLWMSPNGTSIPLHWLRESCTFSVDGKRDPVHALFPSPSAGPGHLDRQPVRRLDSRRDNSAMARWKTRPPGWRSQDCPP